MNNSPLISIIIPVYNTLSYLDKCIQSLLLQTIGGLQLIFVDNGSTDGSYEYLVDLAKKDSGVEVYKVEGGKQGRCRNYGIQKARGDYIGFCDSDDWCAPDMFEKLLTVATKYKADIAFGQVVKFGNEGKTASLHFDKKYFKSGVYPEYEKPYLVRITTCYNKIYKRELLLRSDITFLEKTPHEDVGFAFKSIYFANTIVSVPTAQYFWRYNPLSTTRIAQKSNLPNDAIFDMISQLRADCNDLKLSHDWVLAADRLIESHLCLMVKNIRPSDVEIYLTQALSVAGFLPQSVFSCLSVEPSEECLGVMLFGYYKAQKKYTTGSVSKLIKYKKISKVLGFTAIFLCFICLTLLAFLFV